MSVAITRSLPELQEECRKAGVSYTSLDDKKTLVRKLGKASGGADVPDPMKAKSVKDLISWDSASPFSGLAAYLNAHYAAQPKYDGCWVTLILGRTGNKIFSGRRSVTTFSASDRTDNFPHMRDAVVYGWADTIIVGELLAPSHRLPTKTGGWTNSLLNASVGLMNSNSAAAAATQRKYGPAKFMAFDVIRVMGDSVMHKPYVGRRGLLEQIVKGLQETSLDCNIELTPEWPATAEVIEQAIADGYEGVVLKKKNAPYKPGSRSGEWIKIKKFNTAEGFVSGWKPGEAGHSNEHKVGSLELSVWLPIDESDKADSPGATFMEDVDSGQWYQSVVVAQTGNLTDELRDRITAPDGSLVKSFYGTVIEFMGQAVTKGFKVRHAHMIRLRPDKSWVDPQDCLLEQLEVFPRA